MSTPDQRLRTRIARAGAVTFATFMEEALYGVGGYYSTEILPVGVEGDFVTGSSLSPLFGRATARLVLRIDEALGRAADFLEVGFGSGRHLSALIEGLGDLESRAVLAFDRIPRPAPPDVTVIENVEELAPRSVQGLIFSYELFDAMPVHRLIGRRDGSVGELWVTLGEQGEYRFEERELSDQGLLANLEGLADRLQVGQIADVAPGWAITYRQLAELLGAGLLVTCDYGYERRQLLDPRVRFHGTLACYRRHRVHRNALRAVGEQDLTAHVDFTTLLQTGEECGLETVTLTRQARWLTACGLFDRLQQADQATRLEAMDLLHPAGMGEVIRVLVQGRNVDAAALLDLGLLTD